jgi:hypothetical protein
VQFIDYEIMLKLQCKATFNSAFVGKKSSNSNKSRLWNIFFLMWFYMKYIVKNSSDRILFPTLINKSPDPSGKYFMEKMSVGNNITDASRD